MLLKIKGFSCLINVELEINDLTVIIGEQASGKSVTCKLYFFFREIISNELVSSIIEESGWKKFIQASKSKFSTLFPVYSWKDQDFEVSLTDPKTGFSVIIMHDIGKPSINLSFSDSIKKKYKQLLESYQQLKFEKNSVQNKVDSFMLFSQDISKVALLKKAIELANAEEIFEDVTYVPSGRSFFATIKENVFGFLSENIGIDPFLKNFGKYYEFSKRINNSHLKDKSKIAEFDNLSSSILKGEYSIDKKEEWIISNDRKVAVSNASSGQQEALPLLLVLKALISIRPSFGLQSIVVEEPEAHLFPASQKAIIDLLFITKQHNKNAKFLITTHSPYVLSCMNNGILKYKDSINVNAYFLAHGCASNIIDVETGMVNGVELDKISTQISDEFYSALELEGLAQ